jgi:hypothetical protein
MNKHEFKKGDLVKVNSSYVRFVQRAAIGLRSARREICNDDVGIVLDIMRLWPGVVFVYWSVRQRRIKIRTEFLEPINEQE